MCHFDLEITVIIYDASRWNRKKTNLWKTISGVPFVRSKKSWDRLHQVKDEGDGCKKIIELVLSYGAVHVRRLLFLGF